MLLNDGDERDFYRVTVEHVVNGVSISGSTISDSKSAEAMVEYSREKGAPAFLAGAALCAFVEDIIYEHCASDLPSDSEDKQVEAAIAWLVSTGNPNLRKTVRYLLMDYSYASSSRKWLAKYPGVLDSQ